MSPFARRTLLQAMAGISGSFLMPKSAFGQTVKPPKRFLLWFEPNGVPQKFWEPAGTELAYDFPERSPGQPHVLSPLNAYKNRMIVFQHAPDPLANWLTKSYFGITDYAALIGAVEVRGHGVAGSLFTGHTGVNAATGVTSAGESIDQLIARNIQGTAPFRSVELGVTADGTGGNLLNFTGAAQGLPPIADPQKTFDLLFKDLIAPGASPEAIAEARRKKRRKSVIDHTYQDFAQLKSSLVPGDARRLDQHLTALRDIETRLTTLPSFQAACVKPTLPSPVPKGGGVYDHPENYPAVGKLQIDLLVTALACDLTRVGSMHWGTIASNQLFPHLNIPDFHHALSHDYYVWPTQTTPESYVEEKLEKIRKINFWHAQQLAYLLDRLASVQEADGSTLLDNTVIFRVNEMCSGPGHNNGNLPAILIGGARGAIRTGRYMQVPPTPLNNLYVSIAQAMDVNVSTFGMPKFDFLQQDELTGWHPMQRSVTVGPMAGLT